MGAGAADSGSQGGVFAYWHTVSSPAWREGGVRRTWWTVTFMWASFALQTTSTIGEQVRSVATASSLRCLRRSRGSRAGRRSCLGGPRPPNWLGHLDRPPRLVCVANLEPDAVQTGVWKPDF